MIPSSKRLLYNAYGFPRTDRDGSWFGIWSSVGWLDDVHFPVMIVGQSSEELDEYGNNCSVITLQGEATLINSIDIEFANWEDLSTINRRIFTQLFEQGVQLRLTPQGDMQEYHTAWK